jgi:hypothetical protein
MILNQIRCKSIHAAQTPPMILSLPEGGSGPRSSMLLMPEGGESGERRGVVKGVNHMQLG